MALSQKRIRQKFSRVFDRYGKDVTLIKRTATYNDRGYEESSVDTEISISGLPMELVITTEQQPFKDMGTSDSGLAVPYDTDVERGDHISFEGDTYEVRAITRHFLPGDVATLVRLAKVVD